MIKYKKTNFGFTLVELLVSMSVLLAIAGVSVSIFISVIFGQREIFSDQKINGQLGYALEYMSKGIRMAGRDLTGNCLGDKGRNYLLTRYNVSKGAYMGIKFINQSDNNVCQEFYLDVDEDDPSKIAILKTKRGNESPLALTSEEIKINFLKFIINGDINSNVPYSSKDDNYQPRVTILIDAILSDNLGNSVKIQTTVSQRNLNVK